MPCPFYGRHASPLMQIIVPSHGNQCALITTRYAPCSLELDGDPSPELENCEWAGSQRAREFATFEARRAQTHYPD